MRWLGPTVAMVIAIIASAPGAVAQSTGGCQASLVQQSSHLKHPYRARPGAYCDGSVAYPNAGEIRLVAFSVGRVTYPAEASLLRVRAEGAGAGATWLSGIDKRPQRSYRLDGQIPAAGLDIDLSAAIRPLSVNAENLGLLAWRQAGTERLYLPVIAGGDAAGLVTLVIQTDTPLVRIVGQFCRGAVCQPQFGIANNVPEGGLLSIDIPRENQSRVAELKITALRPGSHLATKITKLYVPAK